MSAGAIDVRALECDMYRFALFGLILLPDRSDTVQNGPIAVRAAGSQHRHAKYVIGNFPLVRPTAVYLLLAP